MTSTAFATLLAVVALLATTMAHDQSATQRVSADGDSGKVTLVFRNASFSSVGHPNVTYLSTTGYNAKGMGPLYKIANQVIDLFVGEIVVPDGYIEIDLNHPNKFVSGPKAANNEWNDLLKHYWALILVILVCGLLAVLMPIIGFCFCCCRCAGACGGRSQPFDKKHDTCRRVMLGFLLILAGTGMVFGVVVAYATNSYLHQGVGNITSTANNAVVDSQTFLRTTSTEVNHLFNENYDELSTHLTKMLQETANFVIDRLEEESKAVSLTQLAQFVDALPSISADLNRMNVITRNLRVNASQLSDGLRGVQRTLLETLTNCPVQLCKDTMNNYLAGKLNINGIDYNQLPDMTSIIADVQKMNNDNTIRAILDGQKSLDNMRQELNTTIAKEAKMVSKAIDSAGQSMRSAASNLTKPFEQISDVAGNNSFRYFTMADQHIKEYGPYHMWAGVAVSSVLLVVLMCVVCGLLCGICGKRPDGYGDDCCNKGAGSRFLMCGVAIVFLTISALIAVALAYFLVGIALQRGVCVSLRNPADDQIFHLLESRFDLNTVIRPSAQQTKPAPKPLLLSQVIETCHRNQTMYNVLRLETIVDFEKLRKMAEDDGIKQQLDKMIASIQVPNDPIWTKQADDGIEMLSQSSLTSFDLDKTIDNLNDQITSGKLSDIATELERVANSINDTEVQTTLRNQALHLRSYQQNLVDPMMSQTVEMRTIARNLDETLKFNRSSFRAAMIELRGEIANASDFITTKGNEFVQVVAIELKDTFIEQIKLYMEHVIGAVQNDVGRCGPLSNVYNSVLVATCNRVVDPFNGFWAGVAWCILIFLPTIVISVKLSTLYQKSDPYPGPLVESEYLYDAYSERDNIPLANGPKNKRRNKKNERRRSSRDRRGDYYEDSGSPHHGGPSSSGGSRDNRYNDMAPNATRIDNVRMFVPIQSMPYDRHNEPPHNYLKYYQHWNGGPPRYQNPPMAPPTSEYERPPPYYFPGAPSEGE